MHCHWMEEDDDIGGVRPVRRRGLAEAAAAEVAKNRIPNVVSLKGGVRGGHSVATASLPSTKVYPSPLGLSAGDYGDINHHHSNRFSSEWWPKGLTNVGNTCYANAALQCLLSTTLTSALLDPRTVPILRRYSSNPNLLAMGSGSVDSSEEDGCDGEDDDFLDEEDILQVVDSHGVGVSSGLTSSTPKQANKRKHKKKKKTHNPCEDEAKRKERERRRMEENCKWLTQELTSITQEYMEEPTPARSSFASSFGSGGRSSMIGWLSSSNNDLPPQQSPQSVVNPGSITRHPDRLSQCLRPYQQEDAHEFLRALLSTLVMNGQNKQLSSLFDGLLESSVTCQTCGRASLTRDRYMDLSLDINDVDIKTLDDAMYEFTKTELLTDDNAVFCQKCRKKRTVNKGLRLATAPSILVCHLKRFAFNDYGRLVRLHKRIEFPQHLEIGDYMSNLNKARPPPYELVGVLVHQGQTCASGHYLAFVKKNGEWFKCNDSEVTRVEESTVMMQQAYILMYEVAEMRENACFKPKPFRKEASIMSTIESLDDATMSKESFSAHASHWSSDPSTSRRSYGRTSSFHGHSPNESTTESILRLLRDAGVTQFISDLCCESTTEGMLHEPETHAMDKTNTRGKGSVGSNNNSGRSERRRHRRRDKHSHECESVDTQDSLIRRQALLSHGSIQVLEVERKQTGRGHRAQTAPRQRLHSDDYREPSFDVAPYTTYTPRANGGGMHRKYPSQAGFVADQLNGNTGSSTSRRDRNRQERSTGTRYTMSERGREDLPPLIPNPAKQRRAKSNGTTTTPSANVD